MFPADCQARHKMLHLPLVSSLMCVLALSQSVYTEITQAIFNAYLYLSPLGELYRWYLG